VHHCHRTRIAAHSALESHCGNPGNHFLLGAEPAQHNPCGLFAHGALQAGRIVAGQTKRKNMEAPMQKLILIAAAMVLISTTVSAQVEQFDGPYGLKALVADRNGKKIFAWKIPHTNAKLLFVGAIYDGNEDLTFRFSRKLLGPHRLATDVAGITTHVQDGKKLYIFFDPGCDTCQLLYKKLNQEPAGCTIVWAPLPIIKTASGIETGTQWLRSAMPEAAQRLGIGDDRYQNIKKKNYDFIRWLKGTREPLSVPMFVWEQNGELQLKMGDEMAGGKLEALIDTLKESK
jgi:hypothetical protein